jgi:YNFM family putative membrane transporter
MTTIRSRPSAPPLHERGTPGYRRVGAALWCAGLATFVLVYSVQGLLPTLAAEFGVS